MAGSEPTTTSFPISLRPWQKEDDDSKAQSLGELIFRMHNERNGFRHITQEGLAQELREEESGLHQDEDEEVEDVDEEDEKGTSKYIAKKRMEMFHLLRIANEQVGFAKDTISLLQSKYPPSIKIQEDGKEVKRLPPPNLNPGIKSMSAALKEALPPSTLSYDIWKSPEEPSKQHRRKMVTNIEREKTMFKGAVLSSLDNAANTLTQAASRLEKDVKRETKYWEQLLLVSEAGFPVFRMPSDQRTLAVQFGAREAGSLFRDRGIAALRANEDGTVKLNQSLTNKPKITRFRVMENSQIIYDSARTASSALSALDSSLETLVRQAQDSLFEEELFHEMVMESRDLQPLGVKFRGDVIHIPLSARQDEAVQRECLVDLLSLDEIQDTTSTVGNDATHEVLAVTFRLLLSHVYQQRLHRRSQIPPPLSERKRPTPTSSIIRPVMAVSQHSSAHHPLNQYLTRVYNNLRSSGLPVLFNNSQASVISSLLRNLNESKPKSKKKSSTLHSFLDSFAKPIINTTSFTVPSVSEKDDPNGTVKVDISTNLLAPQFGTEYILHLPKLVARSIHGPDASACKLPFSSATDLTSFIGEILALDISRHILLPRGIDGKWEHTDDHPVISKVVEHEEAKRKVGIKVLVEAEMLSLTRVWIGSEKVDGKEEWDGNGSKRGLMDVLEGWMGEFMDTE
ncbi:hypothetical protein EG328_007333 [Venturia inaequalis]|uniref:Mediator of RNA polymerase II transcription subunit 17 n=3 Tax=Venturia inaequalis TaxID=5025 RepID=A0A8H3UFN4_VENIN|nr:hypothetical protein EG328_007333 [Venturia inaequalis]KAE9990400.1 hypothetical protein EG327_001444 [Venturia inaequalis]